MKTVEKNKIYQKDKVSKFSLRLTPEMRTMLDERCKELNIKVSDYIRQLILNSDAVKPS